MQLFIALQHCSKKKLKKEHGPTDVYFSIIHLTPLAFFYNYILVTYIME